MNAKCISPQVADWRVPAAACLNAMADDQEKTNAECPRHVEAYPSWSERVRVLRRAAKEIAEGATFATQAAGAGAAERVTYNPAEEVQWRNIRHVVYTLADACFGAADHPQFGTAWSALVTSLTAKDGPRFKLERLPVASTPAATPPAEAPSEPSGAVSEALPDLTHRIENAIAGTGHSTSTPVDAAELAHSIAAALKQSTPTGLGAQVGGWKPLSGAPRDGSWFLALSEKDGRQRMVRWADYGGDKYPINDEDKMWTTTPTHWQPLPGAKLATPPSHETREPLPKEAK